MKEIYKARLKRPLALGNTPLRVCGWARPLLTAVAFLLLSFSSTAEPRDFFKRLSTLAKKTAQCEEEEENDPGQQGPNQSQSGL